MYTPRRESDFKGCGQFYRGTLLFSEIQRRPESTGIILRLSQIEDRKIEEGNNQGGNVNPQFHCRFDGIPIKLGLTCKFRLICNFIKS